MIIVGPFVGWLGISLFLLIYTIQDIYADIAQQGANQLFIGTGKHDHIVWHQLILFVNSCRIYWISVNIFLNILGGNLRPAYSEEETILSVIQLNNYKDDLLSNVLDSIAENNSTKTLINHNERSKRSIEILSEVIKKLQWDSF